jgi:hypothetical protein
VWRALPEGTQAPGEGVTEGRTGTPADGKGLNWALAVRNNGESWTNRGQGFLGAEI